MAFIITTINVSLELTMAFNIASSFADIKIPKKYIFPYVLMASIIDSFILCVFLRTYNFQKIIFSLSFVFLFITLIFNGKRIIHFFSSFTENLISSLCDYLMVFIVIQISGVSIEEILTKPYPNVITAFSSKFLGVTLSFLFSKLYRQYRKHTKEIETLEWFLIGTFPLVSFIIIVVLTYISIQNDSTGLYALIITICLFIANAAVLFTISKLSTDKKIKQQNALLNQQLKMGMENIEALNSAYSQQRKLTHDFNNHLSVIRSLLKNGDNIQATEYTDKLLNSSIAVTRLFDSGNSIVDTLLTQKYNQAKDLGIKMQVLVEDLSGVSMSADKLAVVLSNLLDNAIEACTNTNGEKMIKVKFVLEDMGHILTVQNTADSVSNTEKGQFATTKADSLNHGYGIKNISSIMEDYGYPYTFDYKNGWFTFTAMMVE